MSPSVSTGPAPAVVLAGGVGVSARKWARVIALLDDARVPSGRPVSSSVVERPGLGRRRGHRFGDVPEFAGEVARIAHELRRRRAEGASPVILVAHSAAGFLAEGVVRANPGLADGVLLLDVSVVEDAGRPCAPFERASHVLGLVVEPLVRWAVPRMRRGELSSLLLENAVFARWARDLRELRAVDAAVHSAVADADRPQPVAAVTDVVAVPKRALRRRGGSAADLPGRAGHLRVWRDLAGPSADPLREVVLAPCSHMVMTQRPDAVAEEIRALITRTSPADPDAPTGPGTPPPPEAA